MPKFFGNGTPLRALDSNGYGVSDARALFYVNNTTTPVTVYSDAALSTAYPVEGVPAGGGGLFPPLYINAGVYRIDIVDANGASLPFYPVDDVDTTIVELADLEVLAQQYSTRFFAPPARANSTANVSPTAGETRATPVNGDTASIRLQDGTIEHWAHDGSAWAITRTDAFAASAYVATIPVDGYYFSRVSGQWWNDSGSEVPYPTAEDLSSMQAANLTKLTSFVS
jgi:hypothetical protein